MIARPRAVAPRNGPRPVGPYSPAIVSGDLVFVSGQVGRDPSTGGLVGDTIEAQTRQALQNIVVLLREAGCDVGDVVKATAFIARAEYFEGFNRIYREFFREPFPARSTVVTAFVSEECLVEIEVIARCRG